MTTFVLVADTASGVRNLTLADFETEKPDVYFVPARHFINDLRDLDDGERVAAYFDDVRHKAYFAKVEEEYGVAG